MALVGYEEYFYNSLEEFFRASKKHQQAIKELYSLTDQEVKDIQEGKADIVWLTDSDTEVIKQVYAKKEGKFIVEYMEETQAWGDGIRVLELKL